MTQFKGRQYIELADWMTHQLVQHGASPYVVECKPDSGKLTSSTQQAPQEVLRCAISRYYYGVFLEARDYFQQQSDVPDGHKRLVDFIYTTNSTLGNQLRVMKIAREKADYIVNKNVSSGDVKNQKRMAHNFLAALK